jgi:predicted nucleotidyltransferase
MGKIELPPDFREFLRLLRSNGVRYLLIGGYAVGYYGHLRPTGDMDVWIEIEPENARRVVDALTQFGFGTPDLSPALFLEPGRMVRMGVPPVRLEILNTISGVDFASCYAARVVDTLQGVEIDLISLDDLKKNKAASGRLKDLDDLNHLG